MKFRKFIEENFLIDHFETAKLVPFTFRPVQAKYYDLLCLDYSEKDNFKGAREIILKARKEGFTSLILAMFTADLIMNSNPVRYLEISYKDDSTKQHFRRAKTFILSYFKKKLNIEDEKQLEKIVFKSINEGSEFVLNHNGASFYVGTASTRTGERGGTVQGILFSEAAHYPDTGILKASEIIEGTKSQVAVNNGMVFLESTANSFNHFKTIWDQAMLGEVDYKPRFFGWRDFYTEEEFKKICDGFSDKSLIPQEFPEFAEQAFLASGQTFFDTESLTWYLQNLVKEPKRKGNVNSTFQPCFFDDINGIWKVWEEPVPTQGYLMSVDFATTGDYQAAAILKQKTAEVIATYRGRLDTNELALNLILMALWYNHALIIPEVNGLGLALLQALQNQNYNRIYQRRTEDTPLKEKSDKLGFLTTSSSRPMILGELQAMITDRSLKIYDKDIILELFSFIRNPKTNKIEAISGKHDDFVICMALLAHVFQETLPNMAVDEQNKRVYGSNFQRINDFDPFGRPITKDKFRIGKY